MSLQRRVGSCVVFFGDNFFKNNKCSYKPKEKGFSENAFLEVEVGSRLKERRCAAVEVLTTLKT